MKTAVWVGGSCQGRAAGTLLMIAAIVLPPYDAAAESESAPGTELTVLEEVVVTAQRREQNLLDVPLAVTVLTGEELDLLGAQDLTYLNQTTPNTTIEIARGTNNALAAFIRGVGQQDHIAGFESGVGLYVDDVYYNRPQAALLDIFDVERIEVLRGPQGTLYGRNTVGGAIKYVTRRLADRPELKLRGRVGNYHLADAIVTASSPLGDTLRVGGSFATFNHDGFGKNLFQQGQDNYNKQVNAARVSMEWLPDENWFIRLAADWLEDDSNLRLGHRVLVGGLSGAPVLDDVFDTRAGLDVPRAETDARGISLTTQWAATDEVTFRGIFATRRDETWKPTDLDGLPTVDLDTSTLDRNHQSTAELQAIINRDHWSGVVGFFAIDASATTVLDTVLGTLGDLIGRPGLSNLLQGYVDTRSWALYTDFDFEIAPQWSAAVGLRYTHDERTSRILRQTLVGGRAPLFGGSAELVATTSDFDGSADFEKLTPRAAIQWRPSADQNVYLGYSEGFKGGGFDPRGLSTLAPDFDGDGQVSPAEVLRFMKFDPEQVKSLELGWKASLFDGRMTSRLAVFRATYTDVQIPGSVSVDTDGDGVFDQYVGITSNAADADINGLEWESTAIIAYDLGVQGAQWTLSWAIGLIDAGFNEFIDENGQDVADERHFFNTPDWNAALTSAYRFPVTWFSSPASLAVITTLSSRDDQTQYEIPDPLIDQKAYTLWDLGLVMSTDNGRWQVGLHGRNLADKEYKVSGLNIIDLGLEDNVTAFYGNPRQYWLDVQYRFQ